MGAVVAAATTAGGEFSAVFKKEQYKYNTESPKAMALPSETESDLGRAFNFENLKNLWN